MNKKTTLIVDNDSASVKKLRADLAAFPEIEIQEVLPTSEQANIDIIGVQPDFLFRYEGMLLFWSMLLINPKYYKLHMSTSARDLLGIYLFYVQISQDCIVNLNHVQ